MHPELFELKALVAGRLDAHRRREIDDHLGSCAECSRHYVAMMLGSSSPKTAEAESRRALVPSGGGASLGIGGPSETASYGIDASLAPSTFKPAPVQPNGMPMLDVSMPSSIASRTQVPVSSSLVETITRLRAESDAEKSGVAPVAAAPMFVTPAAPVPKVAAPAPTPPAPQPAPKAPHSSAHAFADSDSFIHTSVLLPTPLGMVSAIQPMIVPRAKPAAPPAPAAPTVERPTFMTRASPAPVAAVPAQELVVTFSSTPSRSATHRSPSAVHAITPSAAEEYVSQAVPNLATQQFVDFSVSDATMSPLRNPKTMRMAMMAGAAVLALSVVIGGYRYFKSSVSDAASAAATAAAKAVTDNASRQQASNTPVAAAALPAPVTTRIVYRDREPSRRSSESRASADSQTPSNSQSPLPVTVNIPDVSISTNIPDASMQSNTSRSATSELTRSAKATATRTSTPRPY